MEKLNCLGDFCPIPIIKAKEAYNKLSKNKSLLIANDHSCVVESLQDYFKKLNCKIAVEEVINGVWEITISKL